MIVRALVPNLEYRTVQEIWDKKAYKYKVVESSTAEEDDNKKTQDPSYFIDVKSNKLRDILRIVLRRVRGISLKGNKPPNLLYSYVAELEAHYGTMDSSPGNDIPKKHLSVLLDFIKRTYASTTERLVPLLDGGEITYDLLWALFKPNTEVYANCPEIDRPRCVKCNFGEERERTNRTKYFHLECRYLEWDGKLLGESTVVFEIERFRGVKSISLLNAFPLKYLPSEREARTELIKNGRNFLSYRSTHHVQYHRLAFYRDKYGTPVSVSVDGRVIVDAAYFRKVNPNFRLSAVESSRRTTNDGLLPPPPPPPSETGQVKNADVDVSGMKDEELLICSPVVYGFSLKDKLWVKSAVGFAVANIRPISWNPGSFAHLAIPRDKKDMLRAVAEAYSGGDSGPAFDDFIQGKGRGLITLLHGPPGVGKTLTAEALSELLCLPLYSISAGEIVSSGDLEEQLSRVFELASHWKALLLLDEADVFAEQRAVQDIHRNKVVCTFLRTLEYYEGIMFLTTNRVKTFDDAITSRIHMMLKYEPLSLVNRVTVWEGFLRKANAEYKKKDLEWLANKLFNGREIKNIVRMASALAGHKDGRLSLPQLKVAIAMREEFERDFKGAGAIESQHGYV
ncbi:P-loop containing nucleoside triphosphate hydrolase protein [Lineolata rhizophorae]|uniref:P-loop containing nucleoside triphosphate hydrolase protein n=1 Tax=Lineolata rhizophorae TaxID=578093 RepID=A0A6A6NU08_9PEZI|nr:P-loop containing nucleoside triphosphate hydrolase protein [Lineolata rhizophorae]